MCPPMWAHWHHLANMTELVLPSATTQMANRSVQPFLHSSRQKVPTFYNGRTFPPKLPLLMGNLDSIWLMIRWAILSPQSKQHHDWFSCFRIGDCRVSLYFTMGRPSPLKIAPSHEGSGPPSNTWFPGPTQVLNPNGISISSAIFARLLVWWTDRPTDRSTDHATRLITIDRIYIRSTGDVVW